MLMRDIINFFHKILILLTRTVYSLLSYQHYCMLHFFWQERRQVEAAGVDYPTYSEVPPGLSFSCSDKIPGYYADPEAQCQVSWRRML